ncbi:hypothetical protein Tco_0550634 [Tanacetum coccineum]
MSSDGLSPEQWPEQRRPDPGAAVGHLVHDLTTRATKKSYGVLGVEVYKRAAYTYIRVYDFLGLFYFNIRKKERMELKGIIRSKKCNVAVENLKPKRLEKLEQFLVELDLSKEISTGTADSSESANGGSQSDSVSPISEIYVNSVTVSKAISGAMVITFYQGPEILKTIMSPDSSNHLLLPDSCRYKSNWGKTSGKHSAGPISASTLGISHIIQSSNNYVVQLASSAASEFDETYNNTPGPNFLNGSLGVLTNSNKASCSSLTERIDEIDSSPELDEA